MRKEVHGTEYSYGIKKCRCAICVENHQKYLDSRKGKRDGEFEHGTINGYAHFGCRCDLCRAAATLKAKKYREIKRRRDNGEDIPKITWRHGTTVGYIAHECRCDLCKKAMSDYQQKFKSEKIKNVDLDDYPHGSVYGYGLGCRCQSCRDAKALEARIYRRGRPVKIRERLANVLRGRMRDLIRGKTKTGSAVRDLGCTIDELMKYLESQFTDGMSWDNYGKGYGKWNIDHIKPLNTFDLENREQFLKACHYTNLRPLWAIDNMRRPDDGSDIAT